MPTFHPDVARDRRLAAGFQTQSALARAANLNASIVSRMETGKEITEWQARKIKEVLAKAEEPHPFTVRQAMAAKLVRTPEVCRYFEEMATAVVDLLNKGDTEAADLILQFMPTVEATQLLDWYFWEDDEEPSFSPTGTPDEPVDRAKIHK